ncbi:MAG: beta-lactamase family protein [Clostridia bacterium]|nr:beta-lactamase family protein [Clostridia bacterium]
MDTLKSYVDNLFENKAVENIIIKVGVGDKVLYELKRSVYPDFLTDKTLFDMASVTKIVTTTSLALIAMDKGLISPSDRVSKFFDVPQSAEQLTIQHLMTHTMGARSGILLKSDGCYENIQDFILNIPRPFPLGSEVMYSCSHFILLGRIIEKVLNCRLDEALNKYVTGPLGMKSTVFLPDSSGNIVNANMLPEDKGKVNDPPCRYLGGVCGNAGMFSNMEDMTLYAHMLLNYGAPLFSRDIFDMAARNYTGNMKESRALGFVYVDDRYVQTGGLFRDGSIGHCGHTGQSVFVDPRNQLYVIVLSDATVSTIRRYGQKRYSDVIQMRHDIHAAIKKDLGE